MAVSHFRSTGK